MRWKDVTGAVGGGAVAKSSRGSSAPAASGRAGDGDWTVYVVEPHGNAVYADARLPDGMTPASMAMDVEPEYMTADREDLLVFGTDGTTASIDVGSHAFAWLLQHVHHDTGLGSDDLVLLQAESRAFKFQSGDADVSFLGLGFGPVFFLHEHRGREFKRLAFAASAAASEGGDTPRTKPQ